MLKLSNQDISNSFKRAALFLTSLFLINIANATKITWKFDSKINSNWETSANWDLGRVPRSTDSVIIGTGPLLNARIQSYSNTTVAYLEILNNYSLAIEQNKTLNVTGDVKINGILYNNGTLNITGSVNISEKNSWLWSSSIIEIGGNLTGKGKFSHSNSPNPFTKLYGNFALDSLTKVYLADGAFEFAGNNQTLPGVIFNKLTLSGSNAIINNNVTVKNTFTINSGTTLTLSDSLIITGTSVVVNGTISGSSTLVLKPTSVLNLSGAGIISSNVTMQNEVKIADGSSINVGKLTIPSGQTFTNNNVLIYSEENAPIINGTLSGTGQIIIGTGVTYAVTGNKGRFELTGSPTSIIASTSFSTLYEYGTTTSISNSGISTGSQYKTFTINASVPARLAGGKNARITAGGRVFSLGSSPVPVTFVTFDGVLHGNSALISWATSMEYNNKEFIVEASNDAVNFKPIATVNGIGTTNTLSNYSITVTNPLKYYRLKQVDFDGVSTYSKIIEVSSNNVNEFTVFPNPLIGNDLYINYNGSSEADGIIVKIYDLNEKVHFETTLNFFGNEVSKLALTEKLNNGVYFVSIQSQTGVKIQKLLVE
ncbi:MAG: hypothetical protein RLZZ175_2424 [Bacteroidota bacterium]|jgi:hypothetical protein